MRLDARVGEVLIVVGVDRSAMKRVLVVLAGLVGLIAATAAANAAEPNWFYAQVSLLNNRVIAPEHGYINLMAGIGVAITAACASAIAGLVVAAMLTSRLPRTLLVVLGLFSAAMLAALEYVRHQSGLASNLTEHNGRGVLVPLWELVVTPVPAFALLALALAWVGLTRRPVVTFAGFPAATVEPRRPLAAGLLAVLLGALIWVLLGVAVVSFLAANDNHQIHDWLGHIVDPGSVRFGPMSVLYLVAAAALIVGGGLYAMLMSRRLHPSAPILVGVLYAMAVVASLANAAVSTRAGITLPTSSLPAALVLGVQLMAGAPGALLAVPLIAVGVWRIRENQAEPVPFSYPSNDPTVPLY
jgi:hypothetical protein